jgi:hypothetical protein
MAWRLRARRSFYLCHARSGGGRTPVDTDGTVYGGRRAAVFLLRNGTSHRSLANIAIT